MDTITEIVRQTMAWAAQDVARHFGIKRQTVYTLRSRLRDPEHYKAMYRLRYERRRAQRGESGRKIGPRAWEPWMIDCLKRNWGSASAAEIGRAIGKTRNAVIGRAHREGLENISRRGAGHRTPQGEQRRVAALKAYYQRRRAEREARP